MLQCTKPRGGNVDLRLRPKILTRNISTRNTVVR
jgi:hypothetical protein